jgi:hypothetical protein
MATVRLVNSAGTPLPRIVSALKGNWVAFDSKGSEVTETAVSKAVFTKAVWEGEFLPPKDGGNEFQYLDLEADFSDNSFYQDTKLRVKIKRKCEKVKDPKSGEIVENCVYSAPSNITIFARNIVRTKEQLDQRRETINETLVSQAKAKVKE